MSVTTATAALNPWARILDALEKKVNRHSYDTWFKPTRYSHADSQKIYVQVPTVEFRAIGDKYGDLIAEAIDNLSLPYQDVEFLAPEVAPPAPVRGNGHATAVDAQSAARLTQSRF